MFRGLTAVLAGFAWAACASPSAPPESPPDPMVEVPDGGDVPGVGGYASGRGLPFALQASDGTSVSVVMGPVPSSPLTFPVTAGQSLLISQMGGCVVPEGGPLALTVSGPMGVGGEILFSDGDCRDSQRFTATASGTVTLSFAEDAAGEVAFVVKNVTDEAPFELVLGRVVEPDGRDGGIADIAFAGDHDVYTLPVTEGQVVELEWLGCTRTGGLNDELVAMVSGPVEGPHRRLPLDACSGTDRYEATADGTMVLRVRGEGATFATYSFVVR